MSKITPMPPRLPELKLAEDFGDIHSLFNSRNWLQSALESKGAKITGAGIGCGEADIGIELDGYKFTVTIRPIIEAVNKEGE